MMSSRARRWPAPVVLLAAVACSSSYSIAGREYYAGNYHEAAAAYESFLASAEPEHPRAARSLYRLALIYSDPDSDLYDTERVGALVHELSTRFPDSKYTRRAELIKGLQIELGRLRQELDAGREESISLADSLRQAAAELETIEGELLDRDKRIVDLSERVADLQGRVRGLSAALGERESEIARLESEIEQIKRIDLESPP